MDSKLIEGKNLMQTLLQQSDAFFFLCIFHAKTDEKNLVNSFYRIVF